MTETRPNRVAIIFAGYLLWLSIANVGARYLLPLAWLGFTVVPVVAVVRARKKPKATFGAVKTFRCSSPCG